MHTTCARVMHRTNLVMPHALCYRRTLVSTHPQPLVIASANPHKVAELAALLGDGAWQLQSLPDYPHVTLPPETGCTFAENAQLKAQAVTQATGRWAIADDSGLCVDILGGAPGVLSARFAGSTPPATRDLRNNELLLAALANVALHERGAAYVCMLALARPDAPPLLARGECRGVIAARPRGSGGFGYDPLFYLPERGRTMAELAPAEKNAISHRGRAAAHLRNLLLDLLRG